MTATPDGSLLKGEEKEKYVRTLFERIAGPYDRLNRAISLGRDIHWRRMALSMAGVKSGMRGVDIGCGTGDLAIMLRNLVLPGGDVVGIDLSEAMIDQARAKAAGTGAIDFRVAGASSTGMPDDAADVVTMGWVLRNVGDREAAYREAGRILTDGGKLVVLDMSRPDFAPFRWLMSLYMTCVLPVIVLCLGGDLEAYRYLRRSTARFPLKKTLAGELERAGFVNVRIRSLMMGSVAIHVGTRDGKNTSGLIDHEERA